MVNSFPPEAGALARPPKPPFHQHRRPLSTPSFFHRRTSALAAGPPTDNDAPARYFLRVHSRPREPQRLSWSLLNLNY
eukprot:5285949-Pyramimonas_sp.AAC.1